jgi:cyclopropane fatty-acyl-phospholipid synthase-like methyltransferase
VRTPTSRTALALTLSALGVIAATGAGGQTPPIAPGIDPEINKPFEKPDVKDYVKRFEAETREVYARRDAIVAALGLKPGMYVADLGAGTGAFTRPIAEKVGREGRVYAVDIAPAFLAHIADDAKRRGLSQVRTVRGTQDSTGLSENSIDLVFACDVYHHLERPDRVLASVRNALRPGGRLVVIDFDKVKGRSSEFVLKHVRADKAAFAAEIQAAGFVPDPLPNPPALKENFFMRFRKSDAAPKPSGPVGG